MLVGAEQELSQTGKEHRLKEAIAPVAEKYDYIITLKAKGLVKKTLDGVKVLGNGELTKALTVKAAAYSASAKEKIEKAGGKAEVM